ncbi:uncharacterized protein LOC103749940 [Nannospalax galili]|uniref:uncharacterized protein LOC103749940 n=1 Tax=Nannospalax galili TaxID=1026970 RepID=UPI0004ED557F|nr:uncharacterized protein LOC103749940 [Nannospalax galili]
MKTRWVGKLELSKVQGSKLASKAAPVLRRYQEGVFVGEGRREVLRPPNPEKAARPLTRQPAQRTQGLSPKSRLLTVLALGHQACHASPAVPSQLSPAPGTLDNPKKCHSDLGPYVFGPSPLLPAGAPVRFCPQVPLARACAPHPGWGASPGHLGRVRFTSSRGGHCSKTGQHKGQKVERERLSCRAASSPTFPPQRRPSESQNCNFFPSVSVSLWLRRVGAGRQGVERAGSRAAAGGGAGESPEPASGLGIGERASFPELLDPASRRAQSRPPCRADRTTRRSRWLPPGGGGGGGGGRDGFRR